MTYPWAKKLPSWLFPSTCLLCGAPGQNDRDLCPGCHQELPYNTIACRCCAIPLKADPDQFLICGQCQRTPPSFAQAFAPFIYRPPVDTLIQGLKFHGRLTVARLLGELLGEALIQGSNPLPEYLIPVPLHPSRLRERGFNQALELARPVARRLGIPLIADGVLRTRQTLPQSQLNVNSRRANMRGAFVVSRALHARHVAILDDVMTTGSTVEELAQALRKAGIAEIQVWACARTPRNEEKNHGS